METSSKKQMKPLNWILLIGLSGFLTLLYFSLKGGKKYQSPKKGAAPKEIVQFLNQKLKQAGLNDQQVKQSIGQAYHETGGFTSELSKDYLNIYGMSNHSTNYGNPTVSGFMNYQTYENGIEDYLSLMTYYKNKSQSKIPDTFIGFVTWLRENGYFTDTIDNYLNGVVNGWKQSAKLLGI